MRNASSLFYLLLSIFFIFILTIGIASGLMLKIEVPDLVTYSDTIIIGTVMGSHAEWDAEHRNINTLTTIVVDEVLDGSSTASGDSITVITKGGTIGDLTYWVEDQPNFTIGTSVGLFLNYLPDNKNLVALNAESGGEYLVSGKFQGLFLLESSVDSVSSVNDSGMETCVEILSSHTRFKEMVRAGMQGRSIPF